MKNFDISNLILTRIADIYCYTVEEDAEAQAVTEHSLLLFKHSGCSVYTVNGTDFVADSRHVLFLPAGTAYSLYVDRAGACSVIAFDVADSRETPVCTSFLTDDDEWAEPVKNMLHYWHLRGPAYHSKCLSEIYRLLTELSTADSYAYTLAGKYRLIHRSVKFIETHYRRQDLYTGTLAELSGIGETYYRNIFQAVFGIPPTRYIQQYRVEKAKELLVGSEQSVDEIAVSVGFANASYFCKVFKSVTGMTPMAFAEQAKKIG